MKVVFPLGVPPLLFCDDCGAFIGPAKHTRHPGHKLCPEHASQHAMEKVWRYRARKRGHADDTTLLRKRANNKTPARP